MGEKMKINILKENVGLNSDGTKNYFYTIIKTVVVNEK
jgi:hypothetical protein